MAEFNVQVLATLRDRVSQNLGLIGAAFGRTETRVVAMRRALADLQMAQGLTMRRSVLSARTDERAISLLGQRHARLLALGETEATLAQRRALNAKISERTERASINRASQQLALTRSINKEADLRNAIAAEQAASAAKSSMLRGGLMLAGGVVGLDLARHAAMAAGHLQLRERMLEVGYGYSRAQTAGIRTRAFALSQTLGNLSAGDVEQLRLSLLGAGLSRRTAGAVLPEVARVADVLGAVRGAPIQGTATELGRIANLFGARTARQFRPIGESLLHAGLMSPGSLGELLTQSSYIAPLMRKGFNAQSIIRLVVLSQQLGGRGAVSPENLATFLARLQVTKSTTGMALALGGRSLIAARWLGLPEFIRQHPHYNLPELQGLLMRDRERLGSTKFLTYSQMLWGASGLRTAEQLSRPQIGTMLSAITRRMDAMGSSAQMNAQLLNTLPRQITLLHTNLKSLVQATGAPMVRPLEALNHILAQAAGGLTTGFARHKGAAALVGGTEATVSTLALIGGGASLLSGALKFAAARGFFVDAARFAGALDVLSTAV
jgi:hypothetical protein